MIMSKTPFRISISGGGTDIEDFYKNETGAVLSTTISKYMYIMLNYRFDRQFRAAYSKVELVEHPYEFKHPLIRGCMEFLGHNGVDIASIADIPEASGLGSSSAFTVGLLHAISAFTGEYMTNKDLAERACEVEIDKAGERIGKQDQYAVAYGGLNLLEFFSNGEVVVSPIACSDDVMNELNGSLMLFYVGSETSIPAGNIIGTYDFEKKKVLQEQKEIAYEMKDCLESGKGLNDIGLLLDEGWKLKKQISKDITNDDIELVYETGTRAGALGGKLCGAGGRGFVLFFVEQHNKNKVREALSPLREIAFRFDTVGSKVTHVL